MDDTVGAISLIAVAICFTVGLVQFLDERRIRKMLDRSGEPRPTDAS